MTESWRPVSGYEGRYEVSSWGRVRGLRSGRILAATRAGRGRYPQVTLYDGSFRTRRVHALVTEAFIGPRPPHTEVAHNDGDSANNNIENLRYTDKASNESDKLLHGTRACGVAHGRARLSEADVLAIRQRVHRGERVASVACAYGISRRHAYQLVRGERWAHLTRMAT